MNTPLGNGLFVFVLGMLVIFFGMLVIVTAVSLCGKLINKKEDKSKKQQKREDASAPIKVETEEVPSHVKIAIVAVISAYYFETKSNCDFVVKKIKRI